MEVIINSLVGSLRLNAANIKAICANKIGIDGTTYSEDAEPCMDFHVDMKDEQRSDVRFFNTIKGSNESPFDTPNANFGKRAVNFRQFIQHRAMESQWKSKSISEFAKYLQLVWQCIMELDFQLNFNAAHERISYDILM
ncbi:hypothetical protein THRCLA_11493 [Thraustotheca clavata]|uniref:Uncharacterized protein n=1 Tax=Thraustotheca clavata TaxID=74557 RepID=A0A1V9Y7K2_9STRA|nr:hypothetical protein THRCLA_11493 [Thraustotheca clavata]